MQQTLSRPRVADVAQPELPTRQRRRRDWGWLALPSGVLLFLLLWQALVAATGYPPFVLPSPTLVVERWLGAAASGVLWTHTAATLSAALGGFALALVVGTVLGYLLAHVRWLERALAPLLAASQAVPIVALAPLVILWSGPGLRSRILVAALITFFPVLINTILALRNIPRELREMAHISGASRWQMLKYVEAPLALPVLFGGIRTGLALATTGAVVGEFVASREGLGALINIARGLFDTPLIFVALVTLAGLTLFFYLLATLLERALVRWEA
ncbi:MAG: ABC transporter permease [Chloroflexaceae bacterium]|nr:ABC transporter permease [Chloroflexaceae bacterium]